VGSLTNDIHFSSNTGNGDLNWDTISGFHISDIAKYQSIGYIHGVYLPVDISYAHFYIVFIQAQYH
jgi:hypothetical protein